MVGYAGQSVAVDQVVVNVGQVAGSASAFAISAVSAAVFTILDWIVAAQVARPSPREDAFAFFVD